MQKIYLYLVLSGLITLAACNGGNQVNQQENVASPPEEAIKAGQAEEEKNILFFGNSLTAGYGLDPSEAFPALIQKKIDSLGYNYKVVNAGLSGETTSAGKNRVEWVLRQPVDIFILELGGNDGLRGISPEETRRNLEEIIDKVRQLYPEVKILLAGMQIPPSMGQSYANQFQEIFPKVAREKDVELVPFLLEGVGGERDLNLPDGIHPNVEGHQIVADNVWQELKPMLEEES
ncbi:arylesterase [soil metagenome]